MDQRSVISSVFGRSAFVASLIALLGGCAATNEQEYTACLTTFTAVGVGAGAAGGAGGAAMGGAAVGSLATYVLCREPGDDEVQSLEPPALAMTRQAPVQVLDGDADGVDDGKDRCAATPSGVEVDEIGCPLPVIFDSRQLNFAFDSAELPDDATAVLATAVSFIADNPDAQFLVTGHTDARGTEAYNRDLSLRRARAVRDALVAQGVPVSKLRVRGEGESQPVATNETESGRARNRRVEVSLQPED